MSSDVRAWIGTLFRVVLAGILFWSGAAKLFEGSEAMNRAIVAYRLGLPLDLVHVIAWGLPILELVLGLLLLVGLLTRWAALGTALIMTAFIVGIASVWIRGYSIDCGCFGGGGEIEREKAIAAYPWEIARDIGLAAAGLWLFFRPRTPFSLDGFLFPPLNETGAGGVQDVEDPQDAPTASPTI